MNIFGIGYRITSEPEQTFTITATYAVSTSIDSGWVRLPQRWRFQYPVTDGVPIKLGASETLGLLGGVENRRQFLYSEAVERAIGDVLTSVVCEILDSVSIQGPACILVFGLAFPKMVGRMLSLRPPEEIKILWICPTPFPPWIAEGVNESILLATLTSGYGTEWDDEALIRSHKFMVSGGSVPLFVQELANWNRPSAIDISAYSLLETKLCDALLPREIVVAAGQVENHLDLPYDGSPEETLRSIPQSVCNIDLYAPAPTQRRGWPPAWAINWTSISNA